MNDIDHSRAHIAIDLGAESGRVFVGSCSGGTLSIREIHRFSNQPVVDGRTSHWDVPRLWAEICRALSSADLPEVASVGVDAWGVDYALIGEGGELLQNPYHYRDPRNVSAMDEVLKLIPKEEIYNETGVQFMPINTLNQLYAAKRDTPELLAAAHRMIMIPDLFHYWLTGNAFCEFTAASTTQFANPKTRSWSKHLLQAVGLPDQLPAQIVEPGSVIGNLVPQLAKSRKGRTRVIAPASHDTASAVAAISASGNTAFLSSGTWSLVGIETEAPIISAAGLKMNFTNEGGVAGTTRLLKNVMGLWMLQCCRKTWGQQGRQFSYDELIEAARAAPAFQHLIDPDDTSFLNPPNMAEAIDRFCGKTDQAIPDSLGAYVRGILESLALKYRAVIRNLETLVGRPVERIRVIGGGSKNRLLNQFTSDATGRPVLAGPSEASVLGNLGVQIMTTGEMSSLAEMRAVIERSFRAEIYEPRDTSLWEIQADRFQQYCEFTYANP
jgi:rhamnulokinase